MSSFWSAVRSQGCGSANHSFDRV